MTCASVVLKLKVESISSKYRVGSTAPGRPELEWGTSEIVNKLYFTTYKSYYQLNLRHT